MRTLLLTAAQNVPEILSEEVSIVDLLQSSVGLTVNVAEETYAPTNQQTTPGDGKRYDFKSLQPGRKIKSIRGNWRYNASTPTLTAFFFIHTPPDSAAYIALGLYDEWNAQTGFRVVDDTRNRALLTTSFNGELIKTFDPPIPIEELHLKVGGRNGLSYSPTYVKDLVFEYAPS